MKMVEKALKLMLGIELNWQCQGSCINESNETELIPFWEWIQT